MGKVVRVKRLEDGKVIEMAEQNALRLTGVDKNFVIVESPIIEVVKLAPVQKKSVEVVEGKPADVGNVPPSLVKEEAVTTQTTQDVIKPRIGRPPKNQS